MRAARTLLCVGLLFVGALACSRNASAIGEGAAAPITTAVQGCGLTLTGYLIAETSRPTSDGSTTTECRLASDAPVDELARRLASEHPSWREEPSDGRARAWNAADPAESVRVTIEPATDAARARHPSAQSEVHVTRTRAGRCPPCGPGVWPPPGCRPCP